MTERDISPDAYDVDATTVSARETTRQQLRGGTLLLSGRGLSLAINFATQVLIVRYLTQTDYGAFAYALAFANLAQTFITFGLDRAITRFIPIYEERGQYGRILGTLLMTTGTFLALGLGTVLVVIGLQDWFAGAVLDEPGAIALVTILIFLAPIQALDDLLVGMFAAFGDTRAILVRRYVVGPLSRLLVVVLLLLTDSGVGFLAVGYVLSGLVIVMLYAGLLWHLLRARGLTHSFARSGVEVPAREVLAFTLPLLSSDLLQGLMSATDAIVLGTFHDAAEVASFRAILPAASLNQVLLSTFALLFTPAAARLFARNDTEGMNALYWRTAIWMAIFSLPVFLLTFSLSEPITVLLFGERYRASAPYLAILSLGMYFNAALGFNGLTLKVMGRIRYVVILNLGTAAANLGLNLLLIPPLGALGAAIATGITLVLHNVAKQAGLAVAGVAIFERRFVSAYASIVIAATGVLGVQAVASPPLIVVLLLATGAFVMVVALNRDVLDLTDAFPELGRIPVLRHLGVRSR
jgi:O-antigen/teichoic acid export membrane protein